MRKRKAKTYTYTRGSLSLTSEVSMADAKRQVEERIDWLLKNTGLWVEKRWHLTITISATEHGFQYCVFDADLVPAGRVMPATIQMGVTELWRVQDAARINAAQQAWSKDVIDELHIERSGLLDGSHTHADLVRWVAFQREYLRHKKLGRSDNDAWRLASGDPSFKDPKINYTGSAAHDRD